MESSSQSQQIERLRGQLQESETLLRIATTSSEAQGALKADMEQLSTALSKSQEKAKEEEEKRVKAITLLKSVRQKLVKSEKDREDAAKEMYLVKERESQEWQRLHGEKARLENELEAVHNERDGTVSGLRAQFDRDFALLRDRHEKEVSALRGQFELDAATNKVSSTYLTHFMT